ncbi:4-hydroxy-tetrahydrodipicolinate reductase [Candidatus Margulisiibacteriota bacterium]
MIKVLVNGAHGRMGTHSVNAINDDQDLLLVAQTDIHDDLTQVIKKKKPDVVLDFTQPASVKENTKKILAENCRAVIGTTGLKDSDLTEIKKIAYTNKIGILVVPNFAIGAVLMMKFATIAAKYMPRVEIIEKHHDKKIDAPSGTAIKTADLINEANPNINKQKLEEKELISKVRGGLKNKIPIHSVRLPGFVAAQEVIFGGLSQVLTIKHDTLDRESFMPGVVLAIKKVMDINRLVYGLENILEV